MRGAEDAARLSAQRFADEAAAMLRRAGIDTTEKLAALLDRVAEENGR